MQPKLTAFIFTGCNLLFIWLMRQKEIDFIAIENARIIVNCMLFTILFCLSNRCKVSISLAISTILIPLSVIYIFLPIEIMETAIIVCNFIRYIAILLFISTIIYYKLSLA